jgi:hypothetical protein
MGMLILWTTKFGIQTVAVAVLLYIVLHGELSFRYPRKPRCKRR